ncbi:hypothetical protein BASA62_009659 [Batrachochytrium salamandrivorans]|nr:hypothetical protein BASA62_009659 [Batrachochytrium salamandrivorans]
MLGVSPYSNELDHLLGQIGTALGGGDDDDRSDDGRSDDGRSDDGRSDDGLDHSPSSQSKVQHSLAATTEKDVLSSIGAVQQTPRSPYDTNTASSYSYIDFGMTSEQDIMDGSLAGLDMDSDNLFNDYHDHHSISDYTASPDLSLDELTLPCNDSFLKDANSNPIYTAVDCNLASNKHQQQHINTNKDNDFHLGPSGSHTGDDEFLDEHSRILLAESRKVTFSDLVQEHTISSAGNETGDWSSIELYRSVSRNIGPLDPDISIGETGVHLEESLDSSCDRVCDNQTLSNLDMTSAANSALETALEESAGIVDLSYDVPDLADTSSDTSMMSGVFEHTSPVLRMESENIVYSVFPREDTKTGDDDIYASPSRSHEDSMDMQTPRISTSCRDPFASEQETRRKDESDTFDGAVNGITLLSASIQTDQDRMNQEYLETMLAELSALEPVKEDQDTGFSITLDAFGSTDISEGAAAADELGSIDMYEDGDHVGGSHIIDDFHQLQKDVDEYIESASKLGFNETSNILIEDFGLPGRLSLLNDSVSTSPLSDKSIHDDDSLLMNLDFDGARSKTVEHHINQSSMFQKSASLDSETFLTPHTTRTIPSSEVDLFSPGSFFAQKSGSLGSLGGKVVTEDRPSWYTPQRDEFGRVIDLIGPTPGDRIERNNFVNATPSGVRRVRAPLYDSPSRLLDMSAPPIYNTAPTFVAKVAAPPEPESGPVVVLPKPHQNTHPVHSFTSPLVKAVHHQADPSIYSSSDPLLAKSLRHWKL